MVSFTSLMRLCKSYLKAVLFLNMSEQVIVIELIFVVTTDPIVTKRDR